VQVLQQLLGELSLSVSEQAAVKDAVRQSLDTVREGAWILLKELDWQCLLTVIIDRRRLLSPPLSGASRGREEPGGLSRDTGVLS